MDKAVHFEIPADDLQRAIKFYETVFDWKIEKYPMPGDTEYYGAHTVETDIKTQMPKEPGAINGGMMEKSETSPYPIITMSVSSMEATLKKIEKNGGKTIVPPQNMGGMGLYARVKDCEGNIIGVWQDLKSSAPSD